MSKQLQSNINRDFGVQGRNCTKPGNKWYILEEDFHRLTEFDRPPLVSEESSRGYNRYIVQEDFLPNQKWGENSYVWWDRPARYTKYSGNYNFAIGGGTDKRAFPTQC